MPEGHVIHRLAEELDSAFAGRTVRVSSPQGRFGDAAALLDGTVLRDAEAYGKHLLLDFGPALPLATVIPGIALWSFAGLMLLLTGAAITFDTRAVWARLGDLE